MNEIEYAEKLKEYDQIIKSQNKQVDELIEMVSGGYSKKRSKNVFKDNERLKLFLSNKGLENDYKKFAKELSSK